MSRRWIFVLAMLASGAHSQADHQENVTEPAEAYGHEHMAEITALPTESLPEVSTLDADPEGETSTGTPATAAGTEVLGEEESSTTLLLSADTEAPADGDIGSDGAAAEGPLTSPAPTELPTEGLTMVDLPDALLEEDLAVEAAPVPMQNAEKPEGGGFDLNDALNGGTDMSLKEAKQLDASKESALDAADDAKPREGRARSAGAANEPRDTDVASSKVPAVVSGIGVAVIGAVVGYFAYQKKKTCFKKQGGDPERACKDEQGNHSEPQVLSSLLGAA
ncbi:CD99 antigen isoform X2 [Denticeps clupeoides]|uniref:CD99 antigen isoform X2 n=1 Tax=Denticeps clupeoides TaxID=299321 RepID=UPI0010A40AED|nr:CD99 antigen-like isoform X2 [Denticeps clupeoides]